MNALLNHSLEKKPSEVKKLKRDLHFQNIANRQARIIGARLYIFVNALLVTLLLTLSKLIIYIIHRGQAKDKNTGFQ